MTFVIRTRECDAKSFTVDSSTIGILVRTQNYDATKVTQIFEDEIKKNLLPKPLFREVNTTLLEDMTKSSTRGCKAITVSVSNNVIVVVINCHLLRIIRAHSYILLQSPIWVCDQWFLSMVSYKSPQSEICHQSMRITLNFPERFGQSLRYLTRVFSFVFADLVCLLNLQVPFEGIV
jgi:hypothetical protein